MTTGLSGWRSVLAFDFKIMFHDRRFAVTWIVISLLASVIAILPALVLGRLIDRVIAEHKFVTIIPLLVLLSLLTVTGLTLRSVDTYFLKQCISKGSAAMQLELFSDIQGKDLRALNNFGVDHIFERLTHGIEKLRDAIAGFWSQLMGTALTAFIAILVIMRIEPTVLLVCAVPYIAYIFAKHRLYNHADAKGIELYRYVEAYGSITRVVREALRAIRFIKFTGSSSIERDKLKTTQALYFDCYDRYVKIETYGALLNTLVFLCTEAFAYFYLGVQINKGRITIGSLICIISIFPKFRALSAHLGKITSYKEIHQTHIKRFQEIKDIPRQELRDDSALVAPSLPRNITGEICLKDIYFRHSNCHRLIEGVNLTVAPGEMVAIAGASGAGKSTLVKLLVGLEKPLKGCVYIDGLPLQAWDKTILARSVALVSQDTNILCGTIRNNLQYGMDNVSEAEMWKALSIAGMDKIVSNFPSGMDTAIGEDGILLSGGQRQRLCLARACARRPKIMILDEATAWLDFDSEVSTYRTLRNHYPETTLIVISHRLDAVEMAERVIIFEDGIIQDILTPEAASARSDNFSFEHRTGAAQGWRPL